MYPGDSRRVSDEAAQFQRAMETSNSFKGMKFVIKSTLHLYQPHKELKRQSSRELPYLDRFICFIFAEQRCFPINDEPSLIMMVTEFQSCP